MTIKRLKELIADLPDDARIYLDDGFSLFEGNSEVVEIVSYAKPFNKKVLARTKNDIDVIEEIKARAEYCFENDIDEQDLWISLYEDGYTPEDFDEEDQSWAEENYENYGLR